MKSFRQILSEQDDVDPDVDPDAVQSDEIVPYGKANIGKHRAFPENIDGYNIYFAPVKSTHVAEIGYNAQTKTLYIRFLNGSLYAYDDVDEEGEWEGLVNAGERGDSPSTSKGKYLHTYIKGPHPRTAPIKHYARIE